MLIKKTSSTNKKDALTSFMINMTEQFSGELKSSNSLKDTVRLLSEFVLTLKVILETNDKDLN